MRLIQYVKLILLILIPIALLTLPANFFDNGKSVCLSVMLLDVECYGCGITRAVMHLIHFDLEEALYYNALSFIVLPLLIYVWQNLIRETLKKMVMYSKIVGGKVEKRNYIPVRVEEEVCSGGDQQISNRLGV